MPFHTVEKERKKLKFSKYGIIEKSDEKQRIPEETIRKAVTPYCMDYTREIIKQNMEVY